jgi:sarcosine oxidase, subunit beta
MTETTIPFYDVIIIGAGSIGAPAALSFAQAGMRTLVLEEGVSVGQGSNKKAIGGIRATHSDPAKIHLCIRSLEIFSTWNEIYGDDIEWYKGGYCFVAYRDQEVQVLQDLVAKQKAFGLNTEWYDRDSLLEIVPDLNPMNLLGGSFSPDDGSASPLLAIHAFYRQACQLGAQFRFNEAVQEVISRGGRVTGVRTNRGTYGTDVVINATGSWANKISQMVGVEVPVKSDAHEAAVTEAVAHFLKPMVVDIRNAPGSANYYFYQHATGQIFFCITPNPSIWGFDCRETSSFLPMVARRLIDVMPRLKNIRVRRTWRGLYPMTPDGFPIVGGVDTVEGFLNAVGMCGQGFMLGPGLGELLVRMVQRQLTVQDEHILTYLSPTRTFGGQELLK